MPQWKMFLNRFCIASSVEEADPADQPCGSVSRHAPCNLIARQAGCICTCSAGVAGQICRARRNSCCHASTAGLSILAGSLMISKEEERGDIGVYISCSGYGQRLTCLPNLSLIQPQPMAETNCAPQKLAACPNKQQRLAGQNMPIDS